MGRIERGAWVGGYQIVGRHWDGALGEAWAARKEHPAPGEPALVLVRRLPRLDEQAKGRLIAWAAQMSAVEVEGVGRVLNLVDQGDDVLLVSELVPGESLRQVARAVRRWPLGLAIRMVAELGRRLDALYELEDDDGRAAHLTHGNLDATRVQLDYDSFELVMVDPGLDGALRRGLGTSRTNDVLGLGRLLYELATGEPCPSKKAPSLRTKGLKAPKQLQRALDCALASDARKRYAAPSGFVCELEGCLSEAARGGALRERIADFARTKVQNRLQGTRTLVTRWSDAPAPRLPSRPRPVSVRPRESSDAHRSSPTAPRSAEVPMEPAVSAFVEPIFRDVTPVSPGIAVLPPVPHPGHVLAGADTEDLAPLLEPEAKGSPTQRPEVIRLLRQFTLLGVLATVGLAAWAYLQTPHADSALDAMRAALAAL